MQSSRGALRDSYYVCTHITLKLPPPYISKLTPACTCGMQSAERLASFKITLRSGYLQAQWTIVQCKDQGDVYCEGKYKAWHSQPIRPRYMAKCPKAFLSSSMISPKFAKAFWQLQFTRRLWGCCQRLRSCDLPPWVCMVLLSVGALWISRIRHMSGRASSHARVKAKALLNLVLQSAANKALHHRHHVIDLRGVRETSKVILILCCKVRSWNDMHAVEELGRSFM